MQSGKHHGKQRRDSKAVTRNDRDKHKYGAAAGKECLQGVTFAHGPNEMELSHRWLGRPLLFHLILLSFSTADSGWLQRLVRR